MNRHIEQIGFIVSLGSRNLKYSLHYGMQRTHVRFMLCHYNID